MRFSPKKETLELRNVGGGRSKDFLDGINQGREKIVRKEFMDERGFSNVKRGMGRKVHITLEEVEPVLPKRV